MILLRPVDPDQPIRISNAVEIEVEDIDPNWVVEVTSYIIESVDVEVTR